MNDKSAAPKLTCERALANIIELAHGLVTDAEAERAPATNAVRQAVHRAGQRRLTQLLEGLDHETALKIRILMIAGRDRQDISAVRANMTLNHSDSAFAAAARDMGENGPLLAEYLRCGHAMACAAGFDLEQPTVTWAHATPSTLDQRAWSSFGRQLASSPPDQWQGIGFVERGGQGILRLYVRLPDHAWWSFQSLLDRPSSAHVTQQKRALATRSKGVATSSLEALAELLAPRSAQAAGQGTRAPAGCSRPVQVRALQGRALRRAARAIRARVGYFSESAPASEAKR